MNEMFDMANLDDVIQETIILGEENED